MDRWHSAIFFPPPSVHLVDLASPLLWRAPGGERTRSLPAGDRLWSFSGMIWAKRTFRARLGAALLLEGGSGWESVGLAVRASGTLVNG